MYLKVSESWQAYAIEKFSFRKKDAAKDLKLLRPEVPPWELCPPLVDEMV